MLNSITIWMHDGLVSSYYVPRWSIFVDYLATTSHSTYNASALAARLLAFEEGWQTQIGVRC